MPRLIEDQNELVEWVRSQKGSLSLAVAFWGRGASERLGLAGRDVRILLDLLSGGTNPDEVKNLQDALGDQVRCVHRLHAKAYIGQNAMIVGSANASTSGLGSAEEASARQWIELGTTIDDPNLVRQAHRWFERLWKASHRITPDLLNAARAQWMRNQASRAYPPGSDQQDILSAAIANSNAFQNRPIWVVLTRAPLSDRGKAEQLAETEATGQQAYGWEQWPDIPRSAWLISLYEDESGVYADDPFIYKTRSEYGRSFMKFVDKASLIDGLRAGNKLAWVKRMETHGHKQNWPKDGFCIPLDQFITESVDT